MKQLSAIEQRVHNQGERLIPGVTHDTPEVVRHKSSYTLFRRIIESDFTSGGHIGKGCIRILDLGCGVGHGTYMLAETPGAIVTGIDSFENAISYARDHYSRENITYIVADAARFIETMPEFDYVVSRHALEHIPNGIAVAAACKFSARLMVNVPFDEPDVNPHHHVHFVREDSFSEYDNKEILYEDLSGVTYYERPENLTANSIICISSKSPFPKVKQIISFPVPDWQPEFLQGRWLQVFDEIGDPKSRIDALQSQLDEARQNNQALQSQLNEAHQNKQALHQNNQALQSQLSEALQIASRLQSELEKTRRTVSWRVTAPLRAGRKALGSLLARLRDLFHFNVRAQPGSEGVAPMAEDRVRLGRSDDRST